MTPKSIANAIEKQVGITGNPRQLRDTIESILLSAGIDSASAAEQLDSLNFKVASEINNRRSNREQSGEISIVHLRGINNEIVYGSSYVFTDDSEQIKQAKLNRVFVSDLELSIKNLSFNKFEIFGRCILKELGCNIYKVTPHAGDQGIDFYGELNVGSLLKADEAILKLMHETKVVLVGQAKHYPSTAIGPSTIRELVGALSLSRTYTYSKDNLDLLNDVQLRPFSPVLAMIFSTGTFTKGARHLAKRAGLIAFSGWQLAVFLADRGIGIESKGGAQCFNKIKFEDWLS